MDKPHPARLLGALVYDLLVLSGLLLGILVIVVIVLTALGLPRAELPPLFGRLLWLALIAAGIGYFVWSWHRGGQTLGLRAWRLRLVTPDGDRPSITRGLVRALMALVSAGVFGIGFLWVLGDPQRRTWHDLVAGTRIVRVAHD